MSNKVQIELEYILKTSAKALENLFTTPSGLSEWFADDVNVKGDLYTFFWDGTGEDARLISKKSNNLMRWRWIHHEEEPEDTECYFEIRYEIDSLTKDIILHITDLNTDDHNEEELKLLWSNSISDLKRVLGT